MNYLPFVLCFIICVISCRSNNGKKTSSSDQLSTDSAAYLVSDLWYLVNYDDGFGESDNTQFLQAKVLGKYSDPSFEKAPIDVYFSIDPNLNVCVLTFSNEQNYLKRAGNLNYTIKESDGTLHRGIFIESDGHYASLKRPDIVYQLLKKEEPLDFRIEQTYSNGKLAITFRINNDKSFNKMCSKIPKHALEYYGL